MNKLFLALFFLINILFTNVALGQSQIKYKTFNQNDFDKEITIYPNPNNGKFKAEVYSTANQSSIFRFVNPNGQVLKTENIYLNQGLNQVDLDISTFQNGVFLLSIEMENGRKLLGKVVKKD